jgi:hypothetical protein
VTENASTSSVGESRSTISWSLGSTSQFAVPDELLTPIRAEDPSDGRLSNRTGDEAGRWYADAIAAGDKRPLLADRPDRYLSRTNSDGNQETTVESSEQIERERKS